MKQGNPGGSGGLWPWKSGRGEGSKGTGNPGGRWGQKLLPSVGGVWIFSGITHCSKSFVLKCKIQTVRDRVLDRSDV